MNKTKPTVTAGFAVAALLIGGCAGIGQNGTAPAPSDTLAGADQIYAHPCSDPRPEICTKEYRPVCATRDNGVRCVTTPCDSTEQKTYGNSCTACSDQRVYGYDSGRCAIEG